MATCCNPTIKTFYPRLSGLGQANKVVLVACMRKLLTMLHAMLKQADALADGAVSAHLTVKAVADPVS